MYQKKTNMSKGGIIEMNAFFLLLPFLMIRFTLLSFINKDAIKRASHFPEMIGNERWAYYIYQITNIAIVLYLFFLKVEIVYSWQCISGFILYILGLILCAITIVNFAKPTIEGFNKDGLYRFSRNPMYVSYFLYFMGCALLTNSYILCAIVILFQMSAHWIILSEERWCITKFGNTYITYMKEVRRYV
ncbi:methyltransferase [Amedibacillus sp. YH-ame10]